MNRRVAITLALSALASATLLLVFHGSSHSAPAQAVSAPAATNTASCNPVVFPSPGAQDAAAATALSTMKSLAVQSNGYLGFQSAQEVSQAKLEAPASVYFVGLNAIEQFHPLDDPRGLLRGGAEVMYPVSANGMVRSQFRMRPDSCGKFAPTSFGAYPAVAFTATRNGVMKAKGLSADEMFMLEIPALHQTFVAYSWQSDLVLVPIENDSTAGLTAGAQIAARDVFVKLRPEALQALQNNGAPGGGGSTPAPGSKN